MPENWNQSGSILKPKLHLDVYPWFTLEKTIKVAITALGAWSARYKIDRVDFLWADVRDAELELINGGQKSLAQTHDLYTEYSEQELYEGALNLSSSCSALLYCKVLEIFPYGDVLFWNRNVYHI